MKLFVIVPYLSTIWLSSSLTFQTDVVAGEPSIMFWLKPWECCLVMMPYEL